MTTLRIAPAFAGEMALDRRTFVKSVSQAGLGLALAAPAVRAAEGAASSASAAPAPAASAPLVTSPSPRHRYAIVGLGGRHQMFRNAILGDYKDHAELVALCDLNAGRLELSRAQSVERGGNPRAYTAADFDAMIRETRPQTVIVTTVDATHDDYIVRALEAGCDVITEKPMTTDAAKCQRILDAQARTGKNIRVTFNYRYTPPRTQVKDILMSGEIGDILSVDFHWLLNTIHGADYFRRWHGQKKFSGGLMVHKATHHFDLVNWWLGAVPVTVAAMGKREYYTPAMAKRLGLDSYHERCHTCPEQEKCGFFLDLAASPNLKALYLDNEKYDGYFRDQCVFDPRIDIEDTMNVVVNYNTGATLCYSLNAFNAWEGYQIAFNGTKGRLEHSIVEQVYVSGAAGGNEGGIVEGGTKTRVIPLRGEARDFEPWEGTGGHGGGDKVMLDDIFLTNAPPDKYLRASDQRGGAYSILVGVAANRCFETGQPVRVADLVTGLRRPDYAPMPGPTEPLTMPPRVRNARINASAPAA